MDKNINLEFIKKFIFGKYIYFGITKYISFDVEVLIFEYSRCLFNLVYYAYIFLVGCIRRAK